MNSSLLSFFDTTEITEDQPAKLVSSPRPSTYQPYTVADMNRSSAAKKFTVISTFAGAGGSSTGYKLAGGNVLVSNEFVPHAYNSYKMNHPSTAVLTGDIKELTADDFLEAANIKSGELDIFDGSPPCTHFSMSGKREKSWDKEKLYHGHKQVKIERLTEEHIRIANGLKPKIIIIENVKALAAGRAHDYLSAFQNSINKIGYTSTYRILNASWYGVPQGRERTFIVSIRNDVADALGINCINASTALYPMPNETQTTLWDGIHDLEADAENMILAEALRVKLAAGNPVVREVLKVIPRNPVKQLQFCKYLMDVAKNNPDIPELHKFSDRASYYNYFRCSWTRPAPTITGRCHSYFYPNEDRTFTQRELTRIMSLPDDYQFADGSKEDTEERIGLMVAPLMMKAISSHLYQTVLRPLKEKQ